MQCAIVQGVNGSDWQEWAALLFVLMTGTVGFFASWWFVTTIFAAVKVD